MQISFLAQSTAQQNVTYLQAHEGERVWGTTRIEQRLSGHGRGDGCSWPISTVCWCVVAPFLPQPPPHPYSRLLNPLNPCLTSSTALSNSLSSVLKRRNPSLANFYLPSLLSRKPRKVRLLPLSPAYIECTPMSSIFDLLRLAFSTPTNPKNV